MRGKCRVGLGVDKFLFWAYNVYIVNSENRKGNGMNNRMDRVVATRVRDDIAKRLDALAKREMRTVGAMARILIKEALDARAEAFGAIATRVRSDFVEQGE